MVPVVRSAVEVTAYVTPASSGTPMLGSTAAPLAVVGLPSGPRLTDTRPTYTLSAAGSERDPIDPRFLASNKRGDGRGNVEVRGVSQSSILRTGLQAGQSPATRITGEACACPEPTAPTRPGVVLDPFGGTGTTALVAHALGRHGISNDMSADYCRLAGWRTSDPKQQAKAARREYVPPREQTEGQLDLLEGIA